MNAIPIACPKDLNDLGDNFFTVNYPIGSDTVMSIQPDGSIQTRPKGTAGEYEKCIIADRGLIFRPGGHTYLIPFTDKIPF